MLFILGKNLSRKLKVIPLKAKVLCNLRRFFHGFTNFSRVIFIVVEVTLISNEITQTQGRNRALRR
jgi:hypothetical protein